MWVTEAKSENYELGKVLVFKPRVGKVLTDQTISG